MGLKYIIKDWAGNDKSEYFGIFNDYDEAWDAVYEYAYSQLGQDPSDKEFNDFIGEYYIIEVN